MGTTKSESFSKAHNEMAQLLKALAHPARIAIIEYLAQINSCFCGDIVKVLPLAQPTVSQHLKELKDVGLIKGTIDGKGVCYCIDREQFNKLTDLFNGFTSFLADVPNQNCCT
jgi:ArsR family transcriptional regulator